MTLPTDPRDEQANIPQQAGVAPPQEPAGFAMLASPAKRRRWPWIVAAAVVALVAAGGAAYALRSGGTDEDTAVERCQEAITAKLKSPATAKFADKVDVTTQKGDFGTYYQVFGQVDAQNGFGALVRGTYHCKVTRDGDGSWRVDESSVAEG